MQLYCFLEYCKCFQHCIPTFHKFYNKESIVIKKLSAETIWDYDLLNDTLISLDLNRGAYYLEIDEQPSDTFSITIESFRSSANYFECCPYNEHELIDFEWNEINICLKGRV